MEQQRNAKMLYERSETRQRMQFQFGAILVRVFYCIFYYFLNVRSQGNNCIPLVCVGLGTLLHVLCLAFQAYQHRKAVTGQHITSYALVLVLLIDASLLLLTRLDVQVVLYERVPDLEHLLGKNPIGVEATGELLGSNEMLSETIVTTLAFQFQLLFYILLVLSARCAFFAGVLAFSMYTMMSTILLGMSGLALKPWGANGEYVHFMILIPGVSACTLAKFLMEKSKLDLFKITLEQRGQILSEKVLRCQAEFAKEAILSGAKMENKPCDVDSAEKKSTQNASLPPSTGAWSAPAILTPLMPSNCGSCERGGDCLPLTAMAWTENSRLPQAISSLTPGERILCFDNLAQGLAFASIVKLEETQNTRWVKVSLADGSTLEMTADHPVAVRPVRSDARLASSSNNCVRAGDLEVGKDCLMTLRMEWTSISGVHHFSSNSDHADGMAAPRATRSLAVTVEQPERHEIFVTIADQKGNSGQPIAVGSANRLVGHTASMAVKNTFIHVSGADRLALKRSSSEPLLGRCATKRDLDDPREPLGRRESDTLATSSVTESSSACMSRESESSNALVKVAKYPYDDQFNVASLADLMRLQAKGAQSFGSDHPPTNCRSACSFYFTGLFRPGRQSCKAGALCEYCHDTGHHPNMRSKLRKLSKRVPIANKIEHVAVKTREAPSPSNSKVMHL